MIVSINFLPSPDIIVSYVSILGLYNEGANTIAKLFA